MSSSYTASHTSLMWAVFLLGVVFPRIAAIILFFYTSWFEGIYETTYWPLVGFVFAPYTFLWYSVVMQWYGGHWEALQLLVLAVSIFADISSHAKSLRRRDA